MNGKDIMNSISLVMAVVILVVISALIVGSLLSNSVFTDLTIINTSTVSASFGDFVTGLIAFLSIIGTIVGVVWLVKYVRKLFDKEEGLTNLTA